MVAGAGGERPGIARGGRIGTIAILQGALARMRAQPVGLAIWLVLVSIAIVALEHGARLAGVDPASKLPSSGDAYYRIARAVIDGVSGAAGFRLILQGRLWLDRGFMVSAAMLTLIGLVSGFGLASPYASALSRPAQAALVVILFYLSLKLTLWPLGPLTGDRDLTLPRAWRAMHGATLGLAMAVMLAMVPLTIAGALYLQVGLGPPGSLPAIVFDAVTFQALTVFTFGMTATIHAVRIEAPATLADVFD